MRNYKYRNFDDVTKSYYREGLKMLIPNLLIPKLKHLSLKNRKKLPMDFSLTFSIRRERERREVVSSKKEGKFDRWPISRDTTIPRLLISVAVISEIGGLTAAAVELSRQTVIHPHSKNIGIHASRNASLVRALMSVSQNFCSRSLWRGKENSLWHRDSRETLGTFWFSEWQLMTTPSSAHDDDDDISLDLTSVSNESASVAFQIPLTFYELDCLYFSNWSLIFHCYYVE